MKIANREPRILEVNHPDVTPQCGCHGSTQLLPVAFPLVRAGTELQSYTSFSTERYLYTSFREGQVGKWAICVERVCLNVG